MIVRHLEYEIDDDPGRVDFEAAQEMLTESYWSPGVTMERVKRAAAGSSLVVGAYAGERLVGYTRIVSDRATFAWVCDVIVHENHRGKGIGRAMVNFALEHPDHQGMRRWLLATRDAHGVYSALGFHPLEAPERWMICRGPGAPPDAVGLG